MLLFKDCNLFWVTGKFVQVIQSLGFFYKFIQSFCCIFKFSFYYLIFFKPGFNGIQKFYIIKWFSKIIICTKFHPFSKIIFLGFCSKKYERYSSSGRIFGKNM